MARPAPLLAPSILAANHARLAEGAQRALAAGASWLHLDIMDGHFVPNLSFGPATVAALRAETQAFLDVHLMLAQPQLYLAAFAAAGAQLITIHVEPDFDRLAAVAELRRLKVQVGLALNPGTPVEAALPWLGEVDLVLAMTVQPGFGGQAFRKDVLPKISALAAARERAGRAFRIEVDGGIDLVTARACREAGADTFVCGTSFFRATDPAAFRRALEEEEAPPAQR